MIPLLSFLLGCELVIVFVVMATRDRETTFLKEFLILHLFVGAGSLAMGLIVYGVVGLLNLWMP